jgi:hypothetical protein
MAPDPTSVPTVIKFLSILKEILNSNIWVTEWWSWECSQLWYLSPTQECTDSKKFSSPILILRYLSWAFSWEYSKVLWHWDLVFPGVRVSRFLLWIIPLLELDTEIWLQIFPFTWLVVLILTGDFSVFLIYIHWFWLLDFAFDVGRTAGATGRQGMLTPPWHLLPPLIYSEVRVRPFSGLGFRRLITVRTVYLIWK